MTGFGKSVKRLAQGRKAGSVSALAAWHCAGPIRWPRTAAPTRLSCCQGSHPSASPAATAPAPPNSPTGPARPPDRRGAAGAFARALVIPQEGEGSRCERSSRDEADEQDDHRHPPRPYPPLGALDQPQSLSFFRIIPSRGSRIIPPPRGVRGARGCSTGLQERIHKILEAREGLLNVSEPGFNFWWISGRLRS